ncbi:hypothetical protein Tco_1172327, partial [Tanacetum coccineum]
MDGVNVCVRVREIPDECDEIVPPVKPVLTAEDDENDEVATNQIEDEEDEEDIYDYNSDNDMFFDDIANEYKNEGGGLRMTVVNLQLAHT